MTRPQYTPSKRDRVTVLRRIAERGWTPTLTIDAPARKLATGLNIKVVGLGGGKVRVVIRPIEKRTVEKKISRRKDKD